MHYEPLCPPHQGWSWSHRWKSRATLQGRKSNGRTKVEETARTWSSLKANFAEFTFHALGCIMDQGVWEIGIEREQSRGSRPSSGVFGWSCGGLRWCIRCV